MDQPRLSICIPTYNRRKYLGETITSISRQIDAADASQVEICVSDNASTDDTEALIAEIQQSTPVRIVYSRSERNMGADANYLRAVELASGDYCWLMGSDDVAMPGSVQTFLREIENGHDVYLCNRVDCDINMNPVRNNFWLDESVSTSIFDLADPVQFEKYTRLSKSIGALFSYLSSLVFKRKKWVAIQIDPRFLGSAYAHVYMLSSFIRTGCELKYLSDHLVLSRGGNDSFWSPDNKGIINRIMIDIDGYLLLAENLFLGSRTYFKGVLRVLRAERPALKTLAILRLRADSSTWATISGKLRRAGYPSTLIFLISMAKPLVWAVKQLRDRVITRPA